MNFFYCILYLAQTSLLCFVLGRVFPRNWINANRFPFYCHKSEKDGKIYEKLKIRKWKTIYPDASTLFHKFMPKRYPKKRIDAPPIEKLPVLINESCIAESTHIFACVSSFACLYIWQGLGGIIVSITYFLINVPAILIQRYNRPRFKNALLNLKKINNV